MRQRHLYISIRDHNREYGYPVDLCCEILQVSKAAYYEWLRGKKTTREAENKKIAEIAEQIHLASPDKGYRRIRDDLERYHGIRISDKRMLRICRSKDIKSTIKYAR